MCGIFGILKKESQRADLTQARRALTALRHRGPDDEGYLLVDSGHGAWRESGGRDSLPELRLPDIGSFEGGSFNIVLGHRRLSIIDLSMNGHQPMSRASQRFWIVFNGEIYNYLELKEELAAKGHLFSTKSDTEVVLAAYEEWGAAMLSRFVGMFALAILDLKERRVLLARDPFGIKPLYFTCTDGKFAFASEIKALLELDWVSREANAQKLYEFLRFANTDSGDASLFAGVRQLPPAHYFEVELDGVSAGDAVPYWSIKLERPLDISFAEAVRTTRDLFEESMRLHMRSDVPVGSCLSGGLDSSAIVAYMRRLSGEGQELHTFSYIADHASLSEERYVDLVNSGFGTVPHKIRPSASDILHDLDGLVHAQEQPFMSTSIYAQHRVFRLAGEAGMKVMLDGQGADEIFAGYYNLIGARITSLLMEGKVGAAWRVAEGAPQNMRSHRLKMLIAAFGRTLPRACAGPLMGVVGQSLWPSWLNRGWFGARGVSAQQRLCGHGRDALRQELLHAIRSLSLPNLLRFEDRNSMCHSIESRVPFCNPRLAEFALSLPASYLVADDGTTKAVLRAAMRGIVPDAVLDREKIGFATPERDWLSTLRPWIERTLEAQETKAIPFLNHSHMRSMMDAQLKAKGTLSSYLWRCLNVFHWSRVFRVEWR